MSIAQVAKLAAKLVKSPVGKLGMAAIAGGTVASIFSGCTKEVNVTLPDGVCMCVPHDTYEWILSIGLFQLKGDSYGQQAFEEWYQENFEGEIVEGCCGGLKPYNLEEWTQKCQQWIDDYHNGDDVCTDEPTESDE